MPRASLLVLALLLVGGTAASKRPQKFALGLSRTELSAAALRVAKELSAQAVPMRVDADDGSAGWELGTDGADGVLLVSGPVIGHLHAPAEVPGHGGSLLRIPQVAVGVRHLLPDGETRCGVAVLELQLDERGAFHAEGLRSLDWADLDEQPWLCGVLGGREEREAGDDLLVFEVPVIDEREATAEGQHARESARIALVPGGFETIGELERVVQDDAEPRAPLVLHYRGVDDTEVLRAEARETRTAFVAELAESWPAVEIRESQEQWSWKRLDVMGPDGDVAAFLEALAADERTGTVSMATSIRSGGVATTTVRLRGPE